MEIHSKLSILPKSLYSFLLDFLILYSPEPLRLWIRSGGSLQRCGWGQPQAEGCIGARAGAGCCDSAVQVEMACVPISCVQQQWVCSFLTPGSSFCSSQEVALLQKPPCVPPGFCMFCNTVTFQQLPAPSIPLMRLI